MTDTLGAVLVAEIGSAITRVSLIDQVDGESRMIGHAETASSVEPPYQNALYGVLEATAQISELTGRQLIRDGQILTPQTSERDGVNTLVVAASAAGALGLVITAIAGDVSARSAIHASRGTYTTLQQLVTLDDAAAEPAIGAGQLSWIERQVQSLFSLRPDAVLIAGGLEDGAVDAVNRLAHIVGLTSLKISVDASGQQRQEISARPVIYAGNSNAREQVVEALSDRAEISVVENLRPALDREHLEPARQELARLYEKQILPRLPGIAALRRMSRAPLRTVCDAQGLMARFLAERYKRRVLLVDAGASSSAAFYAAPSAYHLAVLGNCGTSYGLTALLAERGVAGVARWLPFPLGEEELTHRLLNKLLRAQALPASREDLYIEQALAREALAMAVAALADEQPEIDYDWLIGCGGVLAHAPHPGQALLILLDALQPAARQPIVEVHLDSLGLVQGCGALAGLDPDIAVTVCDRDLLGNTPLATVVVPVGEGRPGEVALEVELSTSGGRTERRSVRHGELVRLPLAQRRYGQLTLRPAAGVQVGRAAPGEEVATNAGAVRGSALGVVIDARGRPLRLPEDLTERHTRQWAWLAALGAEREPSPYADAPAPPPARPVADTPQPIPAEPIASTGKRISLAGVAAQKQPAAEVAQTGGSVGKRISLADLAAQEARQNPPPPAEPASDLDRGLDALRQTVEQPRRRGLFGRRK